MRPFATNARNIGLSDNEIADSGAQALASSVLQCETCSIVNLSLYSNRITNRGGLAIRNAIQDNNIILSCALRYNLIDTAIQEEVERLIDRNQRRLEEGTVEYGRILRSGRCTQWNRSKVMILGNDRKCKRQLITSLFELNDAHAESSLTKKILEVRLTTKSYPGGWSSGMLHTITTVF